MTTTTATPTTAQNWKPANAVKASHRKEKHYAESYVLFLVRQVDGRADIYPVFDLRIYSAANRVYACVWMNTPNGVNLVNPFGENQLERISASGSGYAGGYGYDKHSAAAVDALHAMGIPYDALTSAGGGRSGIPQTLLNLATAFGLDRAQLYVHHAHA